MTAPNAPVSTYRLQIHGAEQGFAHAAALVPYLRDLGVTHVFCSPILQAAPGSVHGYDVVDHTRISAEAGGEEGFRAFSRTAHDAGLGVVVDVVPNHMAVPSPLWHNRALWSVLRDGPASPFRSWFDIDAGQEHQMLMPILGDRIGAVLSRGELSLDEIEIPSRTGGPSHRERVVRYYDHVFPVRAGTESLAMPDLLDRQYYRLAHWKVATDELNYRRFFDVDTLAAIRVEDPEVFDATHALLLSLFREGLIDGFRIDHPDGLADPRGYLRALDRATEGAWVVAEKILEGGEELPGDFPCAGTTGYDALARVGGLFLDHSGSEDLSDTWRLVSGGQGARDTGFDAVLEESKRAVIADSLYAEVDRLTTIAHEICQSDVRLRDHTRRQIGACLVELLVAMDRYRAYIVPGEPAPSSERAVLDAAAARARARLADDDAPTLAVLVSLLVGDEIGSAGHTHSELRAELIVRFEQTCGPVMAKASEDTAYYRWHRLDAVCEVGSDPRTIGMSPDDVHDFCRRQAVRSPAGMTTLSTHDTKRSEDVRARLAAIAELPREWAHMARDLHDAATLAGVECPSGGTEYTIWQTLAACWRLPGTTAGADRISPERLLGYLTKAMREAKEHTSWTDPDTEFEQTVEEFARTVLDDARIGEILDAWTHRTAPATRAAVLGQKLVQLTMPGVSDVYQGTEIVDLSLVDPDNRRAVDHSLRAKLLDRLDGGTRPEGLDAEKMWVTSRALRVRRDAPDAFRGRGASYRPVPTTSGHAFAFARGLSTQTREMRALDLAAALHGEPGPDAATPSSAADAPSGEIAAISVATRLPLTLESRGGWRDHVIVLPQGRYTDVLTGATHEGSVPLAEVLADFPVALLVPHARAAL